MAKATPFSFPAESMGLIIKETAAPTESSDEILEHIDCHHIRGSG